MGYVVFNARLGHQAAYIEIQVSKRVILIYGNLDYDNHSIYVSQARYRKDSPPQLNRQFLGCDEGCFAKFQRFHRHLTFLLHHS